MSDHDHPSEREWTGSLPEVDEQTFLGVLGEAIAVAGSSRALTQPACDAARATTSATGVTIIELPK